MQVLLKSAGQGAAASMAPTAQVIPLRDGSTLVRDLVDQYMKQYVGRDTTRVTRLSFWVTALGDLPIGEVTDDHVDAAMQELAQRRAKFYAGKDADGAKVFRAKGKPPSGATQNRYLAALSSLCTFAQKKRLTPRTWVNPCKTVEKAPENPGRLRFLDQDEIGRLLTACRAQKWPRLYLLVLLALTTGCRRGELERLRWRDVDLEAGLMSIHETKNGQPRVAPLTDPAIEELKRHTGAPADLVFASKQAPGEAFTFDAQWHAALKAAGLRGVVFHTLRHSAASQLVMSGATLHDVGQVLGHKTLAMSQRYSHLSTQHKAKVVRSSALGSIK